MDYDWINSPRISVEYERRVEEFIQFVEYLICNAFLRSYTTWTWQDKLIDFPSISRTEHVVDSTMEY